jgi:hypothetical protein
MLDDFDDVAVHDLHAGHIMPDHVLHGLLELVAEVFQVGFVVVGVAAWVLPLDLELMDVPGGELVLYPGMLKVRQQLARNCGQSWRADRLIGLSGLESHPSLSPHSLTPLFPSHFLLSPPLIPLILHSHPSLSPSPLSLSPLSFSLTPLIPLISPSHSLLSSLYPLSLSLSSLSHYFILQISPVLIIIYHVP